MESNESNEVSYSMQNPRQNKLMIWLSCWGEFHLKIKQKYLILAIENKAKV